MTGKTTLAQRLSKELGLELLSTDPASLGEGGMCPVDDWSAASQYIADNWIGNPNTLIEGVAVPRALRKWRAGHPGQAFPAERFVVLETPFQDLKPGQRAMATALRQVLDELLQWIPRGTLELR
jgi:hypothetical protein